jgi:hypothetical protein
VVVVVAVVVVVVVVVVMVAWWRVGQNEGGRFTGKSSRVAGTCIHLSWEQELSEV